MLGETMTSSPSATPIPDSLALRLAEVRRRLSEAAAAAGRNASEISLLAVSKGHGAETLRQAYALGLRDFGESYVQEWLLKRDALSDLTDVRWHFIGNLQSNKVKFIVDGVCCVQSVDRASVAEVLERLRLRLDERKGRMNILIEMEVDPNDEGKGGISQSEAPALCQLLCACHELEWKGFMGMGPQGKSPQEIEALYGQFVSRCRHLWTDLGRTGEPTISLGMSDDLASAVAAGSTQVRIGTALFGSRSQN